ncbi:MULTISPECIES: Ig-like domain-containing protein [Shewanella]|jgi:hypothetical protein|uniref:Ig-like protein group 1 n=1 Tax=Shewanella fodinae TaxID=552357 RepID=A0A4R2FDL0_9GAMM|nr:MULTISPECIES: invasin domain 3-containing protein [Shewanella]MBO1271477.1 Ig-like domain-containing protein [Shewanella sp. 4t3-1-2LB]TCN85427.1 Ig-like protein group 1 [Shewanella fodinae]
MQSAFKFFGALFCSFLLSACGGGGSALSDPGNGQTPPSGSNTISLTISNSDINAETPATLTATVKNSLTGPLAGELVTFTLNNSSLGTFVPAIGTALTNANGVATVTLATSNVAGAGTVEASIASGASATVGFTMAGDGGASTGGPQVTLALVDDISSENPIDSITTLNPGYLVAKVSGLTKPTIVQFTSSRGEIPIDTAVTENGKAYVQILAGAQPGAGVATATILSGESVDLVFKVGATDVLMGSGAPFQSGVASVTPAVVSAGGTASVSVSIQDASGNPFTEPVEVKFSSLCAAKSTPEAEFSTPVIAVNGVATSTYLAKGCVGDDNINVSANVGGKALTAKGVVNVLSASVGSISFLDATPENIKLKGTGGTESSTLRFKVLDKNGNPVSNQSVTFSTNTNVGGIELNPLTATTNSQGIAQTVVNSGTVSTSVRVTAVVDGSYPEISSQSNLLVISTGLPDQDSFSLSADILNPEGWDYDGTPVTITARLSDAFNNPVPDGTAVSFTTEGGSIEPSCVTSNGTCSVKWTSQNPRPAGDTLTAQGKEPSETAELGQPYGGRVTVLATAIGEESFPDINGNGRFDYAELQAFRSQTDVSGHSYDLGEAFVDYNEDGVYDLSAPGAKQETFVDFNNNQTYDTADTLYNGSLCQLDANNEPHAGCAATRSLNVRASLVLVMSGSDAFSSTPLIVDSCTDNPAISDPCDGLNDNRVIDIIGKSTGGVSVILGDLHNQPLPAGSKITFKPSAGSIVSRDSFVVSSTNENRSVEYSVVIKGADQADAGSLVIEVETLKGDITQVATIPIVIH